MSRQGTQPILVRAEKLDLKAQAAAQAAAARAAEANVADLLAHKQKEVAALRCCDCIRLQP